MSSQLKSPNAEKKVEDMSITHDCYYLLIEDRCQYIWKWILHLRTHCVTKMLFSMHTSYILSCRASYMLKWRRIGTCGMVKCT